MANLNPCDVGIIFHWGPYSIPAYDDISSARKRNIKNGSEWYKGRLLEKGGFRPISGWEQTQKYHKDNFGETSYGIFEEKFNPENWDPDDWVNLAKTIGAKYIILTTKHHDGYCLWPTKYSNNGSSELDIVEKFVNSAKKHKIIYGFYYSWWEFGTGISKNYLNTYVLPQINELQKYNPSIWWFDGNWNNNSEIVNSTIKQLIIKLKSASIVNDRLFGKKKSEEEFRNSNDLGISDFRVYADRTIPTNKPTIPWESIHTIGYSWGYNKTQTEKDYKSGKQLYDIYKKICDKNGRFLINMGPKEDGSLDENEVKSLLEFGKYNNKSETIVMIIPDNLSDKEIAIKYNVKISDLAYPFYINNNFIIVNRNIHRDVYLDVSKHLKCDILIE